MASFSHANLITALESRYDYLSARTIARTVLKAIGIAEKAQYDKADADAVLDGLDAEAGSSASSIRAHLAAPAAKPAPAKAAEPKVAESKSKAGDKPAKKAAGKSPAKKAAKS